MFKSPEPPETEELKKNFVPRCTFCDAVMKPHTMFFDESYTEEWYKSETVRQFQEGPMDALIVIGTALQTNLARNIVNHTLYLKESVPVVEVNLESCIDNGFGLIVKEKSEIALPILFKEIQRLKSLKPSEQ